MKLEVNEELVGQSVTVEDLNQLDFKTPVSLESEDQFLQFWIDEDDGTREIYFRPAGQPPRCCIAPENFDVAKLRGIFGDFLEGNHRWSEELEWEDVPVPGDEGVMVDPEFELDENPWEIYPCLFEDDTTAIVIYDHAISEEINALDIKQFVGIKATVKSPDDSGQPTDDEEEALEGVEDKIGHAIDDRGGVFVGSVTFEGARHFYSYVDCAGVEIEAFLAEIIEETGYELEFMLETDPEKARYWDDLYPPEEGWNLIVDSKIVQSHADSDDQLEVPRRVDFWIDFADVSNLDAFEQWATSEGFEVERQDAPVNDVDPHSVLIARESAIELDKIHALTAAIFAKSKELDGEYVGWECGVVSEKPQ